MYPSEAEERKRQLPAALSRIWSSRTTTSRRLRLLGGARLGYRVLTAPNGAAALQLVDINLDVRLLFTDVGLPGDEWAAARRGSPPAASQSIGALYDRLCPKCRHSSGQARPGCQVDRQTSLLTLPWVARIQRVLGGIRPVLMTQREANAVHQFPWAIRL
jgi:hypothetical protein